MSPSGQDFVSWTVSSQNPMTDTTRVACSSSWPTSGRCTTPLSLSSFRLFSGDRILSLAYHRTGPLRLATAGPGNHGIAIGHESHDPTPKVKKGPSPFDQIPALALSLVLKTLLVLRSLDVVLVSPCIFRSILSSQSTEHVSRCRCTLRGPVKEGPS